jgi:hypothetical protein
VRSVPGAGSGGLVCGLSLRPGARGPSMTAARAIGNVRHITRILISRKMVEFKR